MLKAVVMGPGFRRDDLEGVGTTGRVAGGREGLQLLPRGRLTLALPLALLFVGAVAAVGAAGDGAEHAVMAGVMAGDAADRGAFQASFGVSRRGERRKGGYGDEDGERFHGRGLRCVLQT